MSSRLAQNSGSMSDSYRTSRLIVTQPMVSRNRSKAHSLRISGFNSRKRVCGQLVGGHLNTSVATKKRPPVLTECEVKVRGRWLPCSLYEALTERDQIMRCKYCHGPVQALKESS